MGTIGREFGSSSRRIVALLLPFDTPGTAPAGHPFGTRRIGAHVGSAATVRACLSRSCCRLLLWSLPSGASRSGYARSNANSAPSDRHCVGRPPRPSPPTTSCARPIGSVNVRLLSSRMPVCAWVDAPGRGPRTRTDVGSIDTWEISAAANCSSSSSLPFSCWDPTSCPMPPGRSAEPSTRSGEYLADFSVKCAKRCKSRCGPPSRPRPTCSIRSNRPATDAIKTPVDDADPPLPSTSDGDDDSDDPPAPDA